MNSEEEQCLHRLLEIDATLSQHPQPEKKADALRNLTFQMQFSCTHKNNNDTCDEAKVFQEQYGNTVDCLDQSMGLNNFAAGALSLCSKNQNESNQWVSCLNRDTLFTMSCVTDFFRQKQLESSKVAPPSSSIYLWPKSQEVPGNHTPLFKSPNHPEDSSLKSTNNQSERGRTPCFSWKASSPAEANTNGSVFSKENPIASENPPSAFSTVGKGSGRWSHLVSAAEEDGGEETGQQPGHSSGPPRNAFRSAREQLAIEQNKKFRQERGQTGYSYGSNKKSLGTRRGPNNKFVPPVLSRDDESDAGSYSGPPRGEGKGTGKSDAPVDDRLKGIEPKIIELITNEIMDHGPQMVWEDIAGLHFAKKTIKEIVVWPMLRPDIFTGLRGPPKGLLLFGPPGTGKTLIGKCIASQSKSTFFCISASSLTSKWVGEGEKMVRALFAVARCHQPAVIFIDEVDSLLSQRSDGEHEASRRIKTEFLVQLDGASTGSEDRILVIGATNRPQEIDEAARRRFVKRLYIPLPEAEARQHIVSRLMNQQHCQLSEEDVVNVAQRTHGYSGADVANLCREAALGPIRSIPLDQIEFIRPDQVPPITMRDFEAALPQVRPSVSEKDLDVYITWNDTYGSFGL